MGSKSCNYKSLLKFISYFLFKFNKKCMQKTCKNKQKRAKTRSVMFPSITLGNVTEGYVLLRIVTSHQVPICPNMSDRILLHCRTSRYIAFNPVTFHYIFMSHGIQLNSCYVLLQYNTILSYVLKSYFIFIHQSNLTKS